MKITIEEKSNDGLDYQARKLVDDALSSFCGLVKEIGFISPSQMDPKVVISGGDINNVHLVLNRRKPERGAYHIGACDRQIKTVLKKTIGESVERYSQFMAEFTFNGEKLFLSYNELCRVKEHVVEPKWISLYQDSNFFQRFDPDIAMEWISLQSAISGNNIFIPTQFIFVGYNLKHKEPQIACGVTTGTAVHFKAEEALLNALIEHIQIDSAMGHWYGQQKAKRIIPDSRCSDVFSLLKKSGIDIKKVRFYLLKNADLPGFTTACRLSSGINNGSVFGLGCDMSLDASMQKSYLEACGVLGLGRLKSVEEKAANRRSNEFLDLDSNVSFYCQGLDNELLDEKFADDQTILASELETDYARVSKLALKDIFASFRKTKKELLILDLTCKEAKDMGLISARVFSPNLLSLFLPGASGTNHPRFLDYGGVTNVRPHPYP